MSDNVGISGYSIILNEEDQSEEKLKDLTRLFHSFALDNEQEWENLLYRHEELEQWYPARDIDGKYGFIYYLSNEYTCYRIETYFKITYMEDILNEFIGRMNYFPRGGIKAFSIIYYKGIDGYNPFKF